MLLLLRSAAGDLHDMSGTLLLPGAARFPQRPSASHRYVTPAAESAPTSAPPTVPPRRLLIIS